MPHAARIVASAARDPCALIRDLGGDPGDLLRAAGIDPGALERADATFPLASYVALGQRAAERLGAPDFGHLAGWRFDIANIGPVGVAALRAPRLGAALRLLEDAFAAVQGESELRLDVAAERARLSYRILDPGIWPRDQDAELTLAVLAGLLARAAGPGWRPEAVEFEHAANGAGPRAARALGAARHGAATNALVFPARLLDLPMPEADRTAFDGAARGLRAAARLIEAEATTTRRVRDAILRGLGRGEAGQSRVARALGLSRRSLRRRLEAEGASFREILAECRDGLGRRLLSEGGSVEEIARRLDYSEASAFARAFRRRGAGAGSGKDAAS